MTPENKELKDLVVALARTVADMAKSQAELWTATEAIIDCLDDVCATTGVCPLSDCLLGRNGRMKK